MRPSEPTEVARWRVRISSIKSFEAGGQGQGGPSAYPRPARPGSGSEWTDNGARHEQRHLKSRPVGEWRRVPVAPPLTRILRSHIAEFGTGPGGRILSGVQGGILPSITYRRAGARARAAALTPTECASPLAKRVYDLRRACVSTWLNGGIAAAQAAEWAGHSVAILLKIYAKCIDGQDDIARRRIEETLGDPRDPPGGDPGVGADSLPRRRQKQRLRTSARTAVEGRKEP